MAHRPLLLHRAGGLTGLLLYIPPSIIHIKYGFVMIFEELGPLLRVEREKKGLSIDDVALYLKISGRVILALEEGDESDLPHNVYVRGFVRSYAIFLGFNDEELTAALEAVDFDENSPAPQAVYTPINTPPLSRKKIVAIIMALAIVAGGAYAYVDHVNLFTDDTIDSVTVTSTAKPAPPLMQPVPIAPVPAPPPSTTPVAPAGQSPSTKNTPARTADTAQTNSPAATPARPPVSPGVSPQTGPQAVIVQPNTLAPTGQPTQGAQIEQTSQAARLSQQETHKVIITALSECWIHSNADNTDTRQFSLRKGDTFALTFSKKLTVKLGNAGGVRIRYDGEDMPVPGAEGQTRTLVFPPSP